MPVYSGQITAGESADSRECSAEDNGAAPDGQRPHHQIHSRVPTCYLTRRKLDGGRIASGLSVDCDEYSSDIQCVIGKRERINLTAVRTQSKGDLARMRFSFEVADVAHLRRAFAAVKAVAGVIRVGRA